MDREVLNRNYDNREVEKRKAQTEKSIIAERENMELKEILGERFKEGMTVDELLSADIDDFVPKSSLDGLVSKEALDKATKDASEWKKKYKATLDDTTRQQEENAEKQSQMKKELAELKREKAISELAANYAGLGYSAELARSSAVAQIDNDNETLFKNMQSYQNEKLQELKDLKQKNTPPPLVNNSTKEQPVKFDEMSTYDVIRYQNQLAEGNAE